MADLTKTCFRQDHPVRKSYITTIMGYVAQDTQTGTDVFEKRSIQLFIGLFIEYNDSECIDGLMVNERPLCRMSAVRTLKRDDLRAYQQFDGLSTTFSSTRHGRGTLSADVCQ